MKQWITRWQFVHILRVQIKVIIFWYIYWSWSTNRHYLHYKVNVVTQTCSYLLFCAITYLFCLLLNVNGINFVKITANMWIIVIKKYAVDSLVSILSVKVICRNRIFSLILFHTLSTATFPHNFFVMRRDQDHHKYLSCNSHIIRVFFGKSRACLCHL